MFNLRRLETVPTLFFLFSFCLLMGLGIWQLERKSWKEDLLTRARDAQIADALEVLPEADDLPGYEYRRVKLTGYFIPEATLYVGGRFLDGQSGYYVMTPLKLDDGRYVLVNRGFIPLELHNTFESFKNNDTLFTVEGLIRLGRHKRLFSPENHPEKNIWFWDDFPAMEKATGLKLLPAIVEATRTSMVEQYPIPSKGKITMRNDHLGYAITWFALAIVSIVMFIAYHRTKPTA